MKAFDAAKGRLRHRLDPATRVRLARTTAATVVRAAGSLPVYVVCDDDEVAEWARDHGADVIWRPSRGLNNAVADGVAALGRLAFRPRVIAHSDLPLARDLERVADPLGVTIVPDRHDDGTNVLVVPVDVGFTFAYGAGSFRRHIAEAVRLDLPWRAIRDDRLGYDLDIPDDLLHPLIQEALPWLPTNPANQPSRPSGVVVGSADAADRARRSAPIPTTSSSGRGHAGQVGRRWLRVHHLVLTDGSKGTWNVDADIPALIESRQAEQRAAAAALGARGEVTFFGQVDGELDSSLALRGEVARVIRLVKPDVVLGHDPWKRYRLHPDHRHAGLLACDGIVAARDPHFFKEHGIAHHRPDVLLLWEADEPDHWEDVSSSGRYQARRLGAARQPVRVDDEGR